jgi:hypothetical protein
MVRAGITKELMFSSTLITVNQIGSQPGNEDPCIRDPT